MTLRTPSPGLSADRAGFLRREARTRKRTATSGLSRGGVRHGPEHEDRDQEGDGQETENDAGQGQPVAALTAVGLPDLVTGHEAEDYGHDGADATRNPAHQSQDERRDREAVRRRRLEARRRVGQR